MANVISVEDVKKAAKVLRAVNHPLRHKILRLLEKQTQLTVGEIGSTLKIEQSVCSGHLGILRKEGILVSASLGKLRYYSLVKERIMAINTYSVSLAGTIPAKIKLIPNETIR